MYVGDVCKKKEKRKIQFKARSFFIRQYILCLCLTDLEAMGIPVSSTGPIPENLISLSSLVGVQLRGNVAELWTSFDSPPRLNFYSHEKT